MKRFIYFFFVISLVFAFLFMPFQNYAVASPAAAGPITPVLYIPIVYNEIPEAPVRTVNAYKVNAANVPGEKMHEMSIVWFGKVTNTESYADVRVAYNDSNLYVRTGIIDRWLQWDSDLGGQNLEQWDAFTLLLALDGNTSSLPTTQTYRMVVEFSGNNTDPMVQFYRGNGTGWTPTPALAQSVTTSTSYRGEDLMQNIDIRGWNSQFTIPFSSLGFSSPPAQGTVWGMGMILHDRDSASGPPLAVKTWPETTQLDVPASWGRLRFGMPSYSAPPATNLQTTTIRRGLNGAWVPDGDVGGDALCGDMVNWRSDWGLWGNHNAAFQEDFNISNEAQMEHWPCFSKFYVTFPMSDIPAGKVIVSATLRLYQFGGANPVEAYDSLIQVLTIKEDWVESSLTWNSAPLAMENVGRAWVPVYAPANIPWPGAAREWDVSRAAAMAYQKDRMLRLVLYSAEAPQHTGKYFVSSDVGDWNAVGRPTLIIQWGNP